MIQVSVCIPTFRRAESLERAVNSVFAQIGVADVEIIALDNSPEGSALPLCQQIAATAPVPFHFAHEPRPGVAHARNAALALAQGELIAWLDDDEEAAPGWLAALIRTRRETGAQSVFGPVKACAPEARRWRDMIEQLYSRHGASNDHLLAHPFGIGNSLQPRAMFHATAFDARANETGGEDDRLFAAWAETGASFAWAADALVIEHVEGQRAHLRHALRRAFAYGQGPCETAWQARDVLSLARHMSVGAAQFCVFGAAAAVTGNGACLDRAARGAGKVLWFAEQRFYGATLAKAA